MVHAAAKELTENRVFLTDSSRGETLNSRPVHRRPFPSPRVSRHSRVIPQGGIPG